MIPWITLALFAVAGLALNGFTGLVIGAVLGTIFNLVLGAIVRGAQGGIVPKSARRAVVVSLLTEYPELAHAAFPGVEGEALIRRLDLAVESIARRAITISPSPNNDIAFSSPVVLSAVQMVTAEQPDEAMQELYSMIGGLIIREWYIRGPS